MSEADVYAEPTTNLKTQASVLLDCHAHITRTNPVGRRVDQEVQWRKTKLVTFNHGGTCIGFVQEDCIEDDDTNVVIVVQNSRNPLCCKLICHLTIDAMNVTMQIDDRVTTSQGGRDGSMQTDGRTVLQVCYEKCSVQCCKWHRKWQCHTQFSCRVPAWWLWCAMYVAK